MATQPYEISIPGLSTSRVYGVIVDTVTEKVIGGELFQSFDAADAFVTWAAVRYGRLNSSIPAEVFATLKEEFTNPKTCAGAGGGADIPCKLPAGKHEGKLRTFYVTEPGVTTDLTRVMALCDGCAACIDDMEDWDITEVEMS